MGNDLVGFGVGSPGFGAALGGFGGRDDEFGGRSGLFGEDIVQSSGRSRGFGKWLMKLGDQPQELGDGLGRDAGEPRIVGIELRPLVEARSVTVAVLASSHHFTPLQQLDHRRLRRLRHQRAVASRRCWLGGRAATEAGEEPLKALPSTHAG